MSYAYVAFVFGALLVFSKGLIPAVLAGGDSASVSVEDGLPLYQALAAAVYAVTAVLAVRHARAFVRTGAAIPVIGALCVWAIGSLMWSAAPDLTLRRSLAVIGTTAFAMVLVSRRDQATVRTALEVLVGLFFVLSVLTVWWAPEYGVHSGLHEGSWRGVFLHKNTLAQFLSLGVVLFVAEALDRPDGRLARVLLAAGCVGVLAATGSRTAWVVTPLVLVATCAIRMRTRWAVTALAGAGLVAAAIGWGNVVPADLFGAVGRDESLTGRIPLWTVVAEDVAARPALGYGYGAYWAGKVGTSAAAWSALGWADSPKHAHNAWLEAAVELGLVGAALLTIQVFWMTGAAILAARRQILPRWQAAAALLIASFGVTGGEVFVQNSLYWVLFVVVSGHTASAWVDCRRARVAPVRMRPSAAASPRPLTEPSGA